MVIEQVESIVKMATARGSEMVTMTVAGVSMEIVTDTTESDRY